MSNKLISTLSVLALAGMVSHRHRRCQHRYRPTFGVKFRPMWSVAISSGIMTRRGLRVLRRWRWVLPHIPSQMGLRLTASALGQSNFPTQRPVPWGSRLSAGAQRIFLTAVCSWGGAIPLSVLMNENGRFNMVWGLSNGLSDPAIGNFNFSIQRCGFGVASARYRSNEVSFDLLAGTTYSMLILGDWSAEGS